MGLMFSVISLLFNATAHAQCGAGAPLDPLNAFYLPSFDTNPADYPSYIWMTDSLQKVRQDQSSPSTVHWTTASATQNEFIDFQVHVQSPAGGIPSLTIAMSTMVSIQNNFVIGSTATDIIVYKEGYIAVTTKTATASTFYNSTGTYPDILIPTVDPYYGQTTNAWPVGITSTMTQSAWIDIHIPTGTPSGYYTGTVKVSSAGTTLATLPVVIGVWQWPVANNGFMPSTSTLHSYVGAAYDSMCIQNFGGYNQCSKYSNATSNDNGVTLSNIDMTVFGLDHRVTMNFLYPPTDNTFTTYEKYWGPLQSGATSHVASILPGANITSSEYQPSTYGPTSAGNWVTEFNNKGYKNLYDYTCDEPNPPGGGSAWSTCVSSSTVMNSAAMPTLITTDIDSVNTQGESSKLNIMVAIIKNLDSTSKGYYRPNYNTWLATSTANGSTGQGQLWHYTDCVAAGTCSNGTIGSGVTLPGYDIDMYPVVNRAMSWMAYYRTKVTGELYYDATFCWTSGTPCPTGNGTGPNDPLVGVYAFGNNGDGTLIYPGLSSGPYVSAGRNVVFTVANSTPIYLPSIRLKLMRDSMQDYEYMNVLKANGLDSTVQTQAGTWITTSDTFNTDPINNGSYTGTLKKARQALGKAVHQITYAGGGGPF